METSRLQETIRIYEESLKGRQSLIDEQSRRIGSLTTEIHALKTELQKAKDVLVSGLSLYDLLVVLAHRILSLPASSIKKLRKM